MIEFDEVIREYGITNIKKPVKSHGRDFTKENIDWVRSQIDYFNSDFTDKKAKDLLFNTVQHWYYNLFFKRYSAFGQCDDYLDKVYDASLFNTVHFLEMYNRRIRALLYLRGVSLEEVLKRFPTVCTDPKKLDILDREDVSSIKKVATAKILKAGKAKDEKEEFSRVFQAFIGSLSSWAIDTRVHFGDEGNEEQNEIQFSRLNEYELKRLSMEDFGELLKTRYN